MSVQPNLEIDQKILDDFWNFIKQSKNAEASQCLMMIHPELKLVVSDLPFNLDYPISNSNSNEFGDKSEKKFKLKIIRKYHIITVNNVLDKFELVDKIYQSMPNDIVQNIMKFTCGLGTLYIKLGSNVLNLKIFKGYANYDSEEKLRMLILIQDEWFDKTIISDEIQDNLIQELQLCIIRMLGEYAFVKYVTELNVLRESDYLEMYPELNPVLKSIPDMFNGIQSDIMKIHDFCKICSVPDYHVNINNKLCKACSKI